MKTLRLHDIDQCRRNVLAYGMGDVAPGVSDSSVEAKLRDEAERIDPYRIIPTDPNCPFCGHAWTRHDPDDGCCDAHAEVGFGACPCGRNRLWMAGRIAYLSKHFLNRAVDERSEAEDSQEPPS